MSALDMHQLLVGFEAYLREERGRGISTTKRYLTVLDKFVAFLADPREGRVEIEAVEKADLTRFLRREARGSGEPSRSIWNIRLAALRAFYDYLFKEEVVTVNPALRIDRLRTNPREPLPLTLDEFFALLDAVGHSEKARRSRNAAILQVFFHCALRVGELVKLDTSQVDLENHVLLNMETKGGKWLSTPMNDLVAEALERYLKDRASLVRQADEPALFVSGRGTRIAVRTIEDLVTRYARAAGIGRPVGPHLLRHSGATELADLGTPLRVVQEICGHASVTTTQRYVHLRGGARRQAVDALGRHVRRHGKARKNAKNAAAGAVARSTEDCGK